jgi:asparagine synthase (glutamine-hydrolysing)
VDAHLLRRLQPLLAQFEHFPGKSLLAGSVQPDLPAAVTERAKTGFGVPMAAWLSSGSLDARGQQSREWAKRIAAENQRGAPA